MLSKEELANLLINDVATFNQELGGAAIDMSEMDIAHSMIEMFEASSNCKFNGCLHEKEPKCIVKEKVANKEILESRYNNYLLFEYFLGEL